MDAFALPELEDVAPPTLSQVVAPLEAARAEADAIRAAAQAEGFAAGLADARAHVVPAVAALGEALAGLEALREELIAETEEAAVNLALRVAEQVLAGALDVEPERVVDAVRGALRRLVERERVTILVHPDDLELIRGAVPELQSELGGMARCEVQGERRVARGGAVVRTPDGEVDATVETKVARAREAVARALAG
jgi:flagellar assembly protein FliH